MEFKFTVRGDKITADKNYKFVEGNKGVYEAVFSFDEEWNEELSKVCICVVDGERYAADIKGDRCVLPVFKRGSVYVGVVGTAYDEIDPITFATTLSTNMLFLGVQPGAASEETIAEFENAAELWEKYLYDTCTARNAAEAAKETAVNAAARAEDANAFANAAKEATEKAETNAENAAEKAENAREQAYKSASDTFVYKVEAEYHKNDAAAAAESIKNLQAEAIEGEKAGVVKTVTEDGIKLSFILPKGEKGDVGPRGEQGIQGDKGEKGDKGDKGDIPQKGIDYFTPEDIESLDIPNDKLCRLYNYGDINIFPSDESLFDFDLDEEDLAGRILYKDSPNWSGLKELVIPYQHKKDNKIYTVNSISAYGFKGRKFKSVIIPKSVNHIGGVAFMGCSNMTSISIPKGIAHIQSETFEGCDALKDVYYEGSKAQWNDIQFDEGNEALLNATIHYNYTDVDKEYVDEQIAKNAGGVGHDNRVDLLYYYGDVNIVPSDSSLFTFNKPLEDVAGLIERFNQKDYKGDVVIPYEFIVNDEKCYPYYIENEAFANCSGVTNVIIPRCVEHIGDYAFRGSGIRSIRIPSSVKYIGECAFEDCTDLWYIYYEGSRAEWGEITGGRNWSGSEPICNYTDVTKEDLLWNFEYFTEILDQFELSLQEMTETIEDDFESTVIDVQLDNNSINYFSLVDSVIVTFESDWPDLGFSCALYFSTPEIIPENYSQFPDNVYFKGDSTDKGAFVPEANMKYTILFDNDGSMINAYVSGVSTV